MKLLKFDCGGEQFVFINPEQVGMVKEYSGEPKARTLVYWGRDASIVIGSVDEVIARLEGAK